MPLLDAIFTEGIPLTGEIREVHHVRDTPESPINQVEIQIGVVPDRARADAVDPRPTERPALPGTELPDGQG